MSLRRSATLSLAGALALAACSRARDREPASSASAPCAQCHGGVDNLTGAPPGGLGDESATTYLGVGAHSTHVQGGTLSAPIACTACHPDPRFGSNRHMNGTRDVVFGGLATTGLAEAPVWDRGAATCSATYCHGALPGGQNPTPRWTDVGSGQAACGACHGLPPPDPHPVVSGGLTACKGCHGATVDAAGAVIPAAAGGRHLDGRLDVVGVHDAAWMDAASPSFHAIKAGEGLAYCQRCHGADLSGGFAGVACASCHVAGGRAPALGCTGCHGGAETAGGAPPRPRWSVRGDAAETALRNGAHTRHVSGSAIAPPFDCGTCHAKPATMFTVGHVDPSPAEVVFGGLATQGTTPTAWDRASPTCSAVYCHGATLSGGSNPSPLWTGGPGQAGCGTCHGLPPTVDHPAVGSDRAVCNTCHPQTVDASGEVIPPASGGLHLDGIVQKAGGHDAEWMNVASSSFHANAAGQGLSSCQLCHGANLDGAGGMTTVACADCHRAGGTGPTLSCTGCHGGTANQTGAPPRPQWAFRGNAAEAALRNGAHTPHVTGSAIAPPFDCDVCHVKPATMTEGGHVDASTTAGVRFSGLAAVRLSPAPTWDRTAPTCAVYCHGATLYGGSLTTPTWTAVGQGQAGCGTCHGIPPTSPHPAVGTDLVGCHDCHPGTIDATGGMIPPAPAGQGKHLNGLVDGGHLPPWTDTASPEFHAYSANRGLANCRLCHGENLDGVGGSTTVACADCHRAGGTAPMLTCTGCHGGTDNQTGAPPRARWGDRTAATEDVVRVGAHSSHVGTNPVSAPIACAECHTTPASMFAAGHLDATVRAEVRFQGPVSGLKGGTWNYPVTGAPTCSSTYCHGNFTRGRTTNVPDWTGANQAACGTCHSMPPPALLHNVHSRASNKYPSWWPPGTSITCDQCHSGIASSVNSSTPPVLTVTNGSGPPLHVNGTVDVVFKMGGTYVSAPTEGTCSSMACHPGQTMTWPK